MENLSVEALVSLNDAAFAERTTQLVDGYGRNRILTGKLLLAARKRMPDNSAFGTWRDETLGLNQATGTRLQRVAELYADTPMEAVPYTTLLTLATLAGDAAIVKEVRAYFKLRHAAGEKFTGKQVTDHNNQLRRKAEENAQDKGDQYRQQQNGQKQQKQDGQQRRKEQRDQYQQQRGQQRERYQQQEQQRKQERQQSGGQQRQKQQGSYGGPRARGAMEALGFADNTVSFDAQTLADFSKRVRAAYHPDKYVAASTELRAALTKASQEVNAALDTLEAQFKQNAA